MSLTPQHIVTQARTWKGTRFAHQGRLKKTGTHKGGVDCLGLLVGVAHELGLSAARHDDTSYGHQPDTEKLYDGLMSALFPVDEILMREGDVVLLTVDGRAQHLGIVADYPEGGFGLIHAYAPARRVVEHRLDDEWMRAIAGVFRI